MTLIVAAHDLGGSTIGAAVAFDEWDAGEATRTLASRVSPLDPPLRGPRGTVELAAVLQLLREHRLEPEAIVIDGPVHLDAAEMPEWGRQLFDALGGRSAVIDISTRVMPGLPTQFGVWRDDEMRPLILTGIGLGLDLDLGAERARVRTMHGRRRVPTLMKLAARLARSSAG